MTARTLDAGSASDSGGRLESTARPAEQSLRYISVIENVRQAAHLARMPNRSRTARRLRDAFPRANIERCHQRVGDAEAWRALRETAFTFFLERNTELAGSFSLGTWTSYLWDMDAATLTFSDAERPRVVADIEFAGSYARVPETWLWSWANPSMAGSVTGRMNRIRDYGRKHDLVPLHAEHWHASEKHAHEMTAVTTYLLGGRGAYRVPISRGSSINTVLRSRCCA